jgi:predicted Zn finger-like uncharacterized protein
MRLVCPNCDAQYEVDDDAIPDLGRDVQCSNCGHAWFQRHPETEALEADEEALFGVRTPARPAADPSPVLSGVPKATPSAQAVPARPSRPAAAKPTPPETEPEDEITRRPEQIAPTVRRGLDESLLAVLREEAERETAVRRKEAPRGLETQSDLGLEETATANTKSVRERLARLREAEPEKPETKAPEDRDKAASRRDLFPDIDEINSTLRASNEQRPARGDSSARSLQSDQPPGRGGFRSGFSLIVLVAVLALVAYVAAPRITEQFPQMQEPMATYVTQVNKGRAWLDGVIRDATTLVKHLTDG